MKAVWLSSTYYLDPAVEGLTMAEEVLFVRGLAYCGMAESGGWVSPRGLLALGSRYASRSARGLVAAGLWEEDERGGFRVRSWEHWQSNGDDLVKRRRADRERQARKRLEDARLSRDTSRDVTTTEESREERDTSEVADAPLDEGQDELVRPDVEEVCTTLVEAMVGNGCKRPRITDRWRTEARLMLDRDERTLPQILAVIAWCQADSFWKGNVQSVTTLRAKFDQLRLRMEESTAKAGGPVVTTVAGAEQWLREQWQAGTTKAITERTRLRYQVPNVPDGMSDADAVRAWSLAHRRAWITEHRVEILAAMTERGAA